jgi:hypothetical protein
MMNASGKVLVWVLVVGISIVVVEVGYQQPAVALGQ